MKVHIVPFTEIQLLIQKQVPENYTMTTTRRLMLRLADQIREKEEAMAIITGESLGQVASQTLSSMYAINEVTNTPILRPLITMDKTEIIDIARNLIHLKYQIYLMKIAVQYLHRQVQKQNRSVKK